MVATTTRPTLATSVEAVDDLITWCSVDIGTMPADREADHPKASVLLADGEWVRCSDALADGTFFPVWHELLGRRLAVRYGAAPDPVAPGYVMSWYTGLFGYLGAALFHLFRRVPSLAPEDLAFRIDPQQARPIALRLLNPAFRCLPDDPCVLDDPGDPGAAAPSAYVVNGPDELAAALRAEVAGHGARFVTAFRPSVRFGPRTLWGVVTDALDAGLAYAGRARGDEGAGAADAAVVLPDRLAPFTSGSTMRCLPGADGEACWTRRRESCCFHYKLPGVDEPCDTCPRLCR